ncbi:conserved exported hypothetical protein [Bosea sp. 62]|uniref:cupredoxin domain-containing protein n=1 Tax=unclassified Bosea (in: a-proteobacteria) TaxID=2653178 RepID=UPI00125A5225|nr:MULTISPECIES: cupredoxin family copper-binding protein [unclassified Bosea (in: a-proteobacteria)]CAD5249581.1 conserved exported hypothetical protein [Bosea sp. 46]CAD5250311.1 conserved exported hypothetical protein [Bosea sp. 21B]CAD5264804.1 conserved exported hypothetical protein [Bosea sp. 7B]VVT44304.1 conserved exported hypothetical protein [Bosea sp. EC-HK365B]VXB10165.1 conserved exported hypothetical protein [Bosea sp. 29B]
MIRISLSRRRLASAFVCLGIIALARSPLWAADAAHVRIDNFTFGPKLLTVKVGTTVTFENGDDIPHTVVASDNSFRSKVLDTGDAFVFTFTKPGDFPYFCSLHPHMQGTITVTP